MENNVQHKEKADQQAPQETFKISPNKGTDSLKTNQVALLILSTAAVVEIVTVSFLIHSIYVYIAVTSAIVVFNALGAIIVVINALGAIILLQAQQQKELQEQQQKELEQKQQQANEDLQNQIEQLKQAKDQEIQKLKQPSLR